MNPRTMIVPKPNVRTRGSSTNPTSTAIATDVAIIASGADARAHVVAPMMAIPTTSAGSEARRRCLLANSSAATNS